MLQVYQQIIGWIRKPLLAVEKEQTYEQPTKKMKAIIFAHINALARSEAWPL